MARLYDVPLGKLNEFIRLLSGAGLTAEEVEAVIYEPELAELMIRPLKERYVRYTDKLLTLDEQFELICRYNDQYWGGYFSEKELEAYHPKLSGDEKQSVDNLLILHVEFDSLQETIEMWWKVFVGEQPSFWIWEPLGTEEEQQLALSDKQLKLLPTQVDTYPAKTITQVRINLVAHWYPHQGRVLSQIRADAKAAGRTLAQAEVMSAYGLHSALFREQDGKNLPWANMAGIQISAIPVEITTPPAQPEPGALYVGCESRDEAQIGVLLATFKAHRGSAPVILPTTLS